MSEPEHIKDMRKALNDLNKDINAASERCTSADFHQAYAIADVAKALTTLALVGYAAVCEWHNARTGGDDDA